MHRIVSSSPSGRHPFVTAPAPASHATLPAAPAANAGS